MEVWYEYRVIGVEDPIVGRVTVGDWDNKKAIDLQDAIWVKEGQNLGVAAASGLCLWKAGPLNMKRRLAEIFEYGAEAEVKVTAITAKNCDDAFSAIVRTEPKAERNSRKRGVAELLGLYVKQPSQLHKSASLLANLGRDVMDVCRPCRESFEVAPIVLMDPLLAEFVANCQDRVPSETDQQLTWKIAQTMSQKFEDEGLRVAAFWKCLNALGFAGIIKLTTKNGITDGTILGDKGSMILNMELKNEIGEGGGSIHVQNAAYVAQHWASDQLETVRNACRCPTLLIEVAGPNISFSTFCFSGDDRVVWEQATPMYSMAVPQYCRHFYELARCFSALRVLIPQLQKFYSNLVLADHADGSLGFPYVNNYKVDSNEVQFQYTSKLAANCYLGQSTLHGLVVIKFAKQYGIEGHNFMALEGYAPKLYSYEELFSGWWMIVMEYVTGNMWARTHAQQLSTELVSALECMHNAKLVHGDFRPCNILVTDNMHVKIIDFDWAGKEGSVHYPPFLNRQIPWPDGVEGGGLIASQHDRYWLELLCRGGGGTLFEVGTVRIS